MTTVLSFTFLFLSNTLYFCPVYSVLCISLNGGPALAIATTGVKRTPSNSCSQSQFIARLVTHPIQATFTAEYTGAC